MSQKTSISKTRRKIPFFLVLFMVLASLIPAFALASSVTLPPSSVIQGLGNPPISHDAELFEGAPSHLIEIIDEDRYANTYSVNLTSGTAYSFVVSGFEFDMLFLITNASGDVLIDSRDAQVVYDGLELRLIAPTTGTYHVLISSAAGIEEGDYTLSINAIPNFATLSGVVQNDAGQLLENIVVTAYRQTVTPQGVEYIAELSTTTATNGSYTLSPLVPGSYKLSFRDLDFNYGHIYYHQMYALEAADTVAAPANANLTLQNTILTQSGAITGTVTDTGNTPLEDIIVSVFVEDSGDFFALSSTDTDVNGEFALTGLENGTYFVQFSCPDGLFLTQYYAATNSVETATPLPLVAEDVREDIDAVLAPAATISGTARNSSNIPVEDIVVSLLRLGTGVINPETLDCFEIINQTITETDGAYFFGALAAGTYFLHFSDTQGRFIDLYYVDGFVPARAGPITLANAQRLSGRDVTLTLDSSISGTVADTSLNLLPGIAVRLFNMAGAPNPITQEFLENPAHETFTDDFGNFTLAGIIPGTYIMEFSDVTGEHSTLYHFQHDDPNAANSITITAGTHLTGHNATLSPAAHITGILVDEVTGLPVYPAQVFLFENTSNLTPLYTAQTSSDGVFAFAALDAGTYYLGFAPAGYTIPDNLQFFEDAFDADDATVISLDAREFVDLDQLFWRPLPTVTLTLNGQNGMPAQTTEYTQGTTLDALPTPVRTGYNFMGWHTQMVGGTLATLPLTLDFDTVLFAHWSPADFRISFDSQGGSAVPDHFFNFGDAMGALPTPTREGYSFVGWFDRSQGGTNITGTTPVTRSQTLYGQWAVSTYGVVFDSQGGSFVAQMPAHFGKALEALPTPHKPFHTFLGWYSSSTGGTRISADHIVTSDITLFARWRAGQVNITFDAHGGRTIAAQTREVGARLGSLPVPERMGRVFGGWTLDSAGRQPVGPQTRATADMALYAQWRSNDARLQQVSRSAGTLTTHFAPGSLNSRLNLRSTISQVTITPIPRDSAARIQMRTSDRQSFQNASSLRLNIPRGEHRTVQIRVTSQDRQSNRIYRITVRCAWTHE
ncbi:MAG: InlB B-repeat-containing protein [Coriobacteriia bacterium]|nr:InlB B-repeat-containing protein [Coriobacteriia bacterium]